MKCEKLSDSIIESVSKIMTNYASGSEIDSLFRQCNIIDTSGESTKWKRISRTFIALQDKTGTSNNFLDFIQKWAEPARYISSKIDYQQILSDINRPLMLAGLGVGEDGRLRNVDKASTISEVHQRTRNLYSRLISRNIHPDVMKYCKDEYLNEDYFHAVHEAAKSLCQKIRDKTGINKDGSDLINYSFSKDNPKLALNFLETQTELNEQIGLKEMLNGIIHMIRNPTAHELRRDWIFKEEAAVEILTIISFLHKKLDECTLIPEPVKE